MARCHFAVIIVNFRTPDLSLAAARSLAPELADVDGRIVIVDNGSGDGSFETMTHAISALPSAGRIAVVDAGRNGGFSAGNNVGFGAIEADWYLLLNSDAVAKPDALTALAAAARLDPGAAIIAPTIVNNDGDTEVSRFRQHSVAGEFLDGAQAGPLTRLFPGAEVPIFPQDKESEPDWVSFAAVLLNGDAVRTAGPMDEGFFLYYEDCDYCLRLTETGRSIAFAPDAVFAHDAGGSTKLRETSEAHGRLPAYYYRSRNRYFRKIRGPMGPFLANTAWCAGRLIAKLRGLIGRTAPAVSEGRLRDIWIGWRSGR